MKDKVLKTGVLLGAVILVSSCGTDGEDISVNGDISSTSSVSLYITDKPDTDLEEVNITINKIEFKNTGTNEKCTLFEYNPSSQEENPLENINLLELMDSYLFVNQTQCPRVPYNRLKIEFEREVSVKKDGQMYSCMVEGFHNENGKQPNRPHCVGNSCFIELNGAVNIAAHVEDVAVDFDIKKSKIIFNENGDCSVVFKVSPLKVDKKHFKQKKLKLHGFIKDLDTQNKEFTFYSRRREIIVDYSNVEQENIDQILSFAQEYWFDRRVGIKVKCKTFEREIQLCEAEKITLVLRNIMVDNIDDTEKTFDVNLNENTILTINYLNAEIEGNLINGSYAKIDINSANYTEETGFLYNAEKIKLKEFEE